MHIAFHDGRQTQNVGRHTQTHPVQNHDDEEALERLAEIVEIEGGVRPHTGDRRRRPLRSKRPDALETAGDGRIVAAVKLAAEELDAENPKDELRRDETGMQEEMEEGWDYRWDYRFSALCRKWVL